MLHNISFLFDGGDGDQSFFGESFLAVPVNENWFKPVSENKDSTLLKIISGSNRGRYLVVESRLVESLASQLSHRRFPSLIVQLISQPGPNFSDNIIAIGMSAPEVQRN